MVVPVITDYENQIIPTLAHPVINKLVLASAHMELPFVDMTVASIYQVGGRTFLGK